MPAWNEQDTLPRTVQECDAAIAALGIPAEIVVCDDGSTDRTADVLRELGKTRPHLRVVTRERNGGYGAALSSAIAAARGELVVTMDSDGQFDPADAGLLLRTLAEGGDVVLGYRARKVDRFARVQLDRCLRLLVRVLFGVSFRDTNCALRLVPAAALREITMEARGFANPTEVALKLQARGLRMKEVAITHRERAAGASTLRSLRTSLDMMAFLLYLRLKIALFRRRVLQSL
jgi:glycosyltransferase involved in cell wall biosynthesis